MFLDVLLFAFICAMVKPHYLGNGHPFHILGTFNGWMKIGPGAGSNLAQANAFHSTEHLHNTLADAGLYPLGGILTSIHSST